LQFCTETLKANQVIDYTQESWWEVLGANSVDVVYDCIGATSPISAACSSSFPFISPSVLGFINSLLLFMKFASLR